MKIEDIFSKDLNRDINGVVKAEQVDNESVYVELDEYVVTGELDRHFREFFEAYLPVCDAKFNPNTKMGVWIKGFFGSGKSHYLKILSYLLENRHVEKEGITRSAIDFFEEKITDPMLLADIHRAISTPADVILFNIDSRANTDEAENAILKVFLKVFNERVGYCADFPHIAHLERELDKHGQYQLFKDSFEQLTGANWQKNSDAYDFYRDELAQALSTATEQSLESTRQWVEQLENNFPLDVQNFCKWVNEYIENNQGRHVLFLVDEVGQFIGKNTQMMLKLQTIVEDLGTVCGGRAWVVVTSQADLDAAIGNMGKNQSNDFSKIQGRFAITPSLSSSNTSEVIQKRLLEKTAAAHQELTKIFADKGDILRNQLSFDKTTTANLKPFEDAPSFVDNYPFIPYHYPLVQKVFESIRTKGATGQHLAMGERSLLDAFQSAAKQQKNNDLDVLIPFYCFYSPIESFLEPAVKRTIDQACELKTLTKFDCKILKTLFLIRYVDTLKSTLDNLVTLSIEKIDSDKINLKKQIEESLIRLERQFLIARNGDEFIFLTNEEKEIETEISRTDVETSAISNKLSVIIFDHILRRQTSYQYPVNKHPFKISRFCNGHPKDGTNLEDLVLKIISPLDPHYESFGQNQYCIDYSLEGDGCVLIKLGEQQRLWNELETFIKTERFLKQNAGQRAEQEYLLRDKQMENMAREKRLNGELESLFIDADVYAIGTKLAKKTVTPSTLLEDAFRYTIENSFAKLKLLRPSTGDILQEIQAIFSANEITQTKLDFSVEECNPQALTELENYIKLKVEQHDPLYLRDIVNHFNHRPYGWADNEILLLSARLAVAGKIRFSLKNQALSLQKAYEPFTNGRKRAELRIQIIRQHDEVQLKKAASLVKSLFSKTFTGTGEKELFEMIKAELKNWHESLKSFANKAQTGKFPATDKIEKGLVLVSQLQQNTNSFSLIEQLLAESKSLEGFA
ncbi:MAG: BREX system P-loop protein BrxC, partial [Methylococcaceae bacterium]|nr:BREX system P-loop protein BrxC [Methylococcaceae bacterium]